MNRHYEYNIPITNYNKKTMIEMLNRKQITSRYSGKLVEFVESIDVSSLNGSSVVSTGCYFVDAIAGEISDWKDLILHQKDGSQISMEDYIEGLCSYTNPNVNPSFIDYETQDRKVIKSMKGLENIHFIKAKTIGDLKTILEQIPDEYDYAFLNNEEFGMVVDDEQKKVDLWDLENLYREIGELVDTEVFDYYEKGRQTSILTSPTSRDDTRGIGDYTINDEVIEQYIQVIKDEDDFLRTAYPEDDN